MQRGNAFAVEPGGERADDYGERGDSETCAAGEEIVLNVYGDYAN
jgi:hypothetical protein